MIQRELKEGCRDRYVYFYKGLLRTPAQLVEFSTCGLTEKNIADRLRSRKYTSLSDLLNDPKSRGKSKKVPVDWGLLDSAWPVN